MFFLFEWILTIILIEFKYLLMPFSFFSRNFPDESADSGLTRHRGGGLRGTQKDLCRVLLVKVGTWQWALHAMLPTPGPPPHSFPVLCYLCCHYLYYFDFNVGAQVHRSICWDGCPNHYKLVLHGVWTHTANICELWVRSLQITCICMHAPRSLAPNKLYGHNPHPDLLHYGLVRHFYHGNAENSWHGPTEFLGWK